jgi:branched-chain amino acid transport system substrate-binding protein
MNKRKDNRPKKLDLRKSIDRRTFIKSTAMVAGMTFSTLGFPGIVRSAKVPGEIEIGVIYPMTGSSGPMGQNAIRGWNIAVDEINDSGGIKSLGGAMIKTLLRDSESDPKVGVAETEKLVKTKVVAIVGAWNSTVTYACTEVAERNRIPWMVSLSTADEICRRGFKYIFRTVVEGSRMAETLVSFAEEIGEKTGKRAKTAVIMGIDDYFGKNASKSIKGALNKFKKECVGDILYPINATSLKDEIAGTADKKPDVWFLSSYFKDAILVTNTLYDQKVKCLGFLAYGAGFIDPQYLKQVGNLGENFFAITKFDHDLNTELEQGFEKKMKTRYSVSANQHSACCYVEAYILKDSLERAKSLDRDKLRDAIESTNMTSGPALLIPGKGVKYDQNHENAYAQDLMSQVIKGGWHTVWPLERKRKFDPVWPRPDWPSKRSWG